MPLGRRIAGASPLVVDGLLAVSALAVGLAEVAFGFRDGGVGQPLSGPPAAELVVVAALTLPLAWRRRRPLPAVVVVATAMAAQVLFLSPSAPFLVGLVPLLILNFDVARGSARAAVVGLTVSAGALAVVSFEVPAMQAAGEIIFSCGIVVGIWFAGRYAGRRQRRADQLLTYAVRLESDQEQRARDAIAAERARIAGELHDIVAHSVSVMGVQAGAARAMLDTDPERARQALQVIEATARDAIGELRRLLGILRTDDHDDAAGLAPQPGLSDLDRLVGQVRETGLNVDVHVQGDKRPLSPGVDLAAYRIVQEALTNVVKHAGPGNAEVHIRYNGHSVDVEVTDHGPSHPADEAANVAGCGQGLVGMHERVAVYGGSLEAGPIAGRGFRVHAVLPTTADL